MHSLCELQASSHPLLSPPFAGFPEDPTRGSVVDEWRVVPSTVFEGGALPALYGGAWTMYEGGQQSYFYVAELLTADNPWYGLKGGMAVKALFLRPNWEMGGLTQEGSLGSLGGGTQTFYGGEAASRFFREQYAPRAQLQADAVAPVLKSFFDDSQLPPSEWVDAVLAAGPHQMPPSAPSAPPNPPAFPPLLAPAVSERSHLYDGSIGHCKHAAAGALGLVMP